MRLDDWPESQPATPSPDAETADAPLPPLTGAGEGLTAPPLDVQPRFGAGEGQSRAAAPPLADGAAPPTPDARLTAGTGQPASPDNSADLPPAGAAPPGERPPLSPAAAALDNARRGTWMMDEHLDGWVLLGADGRPVMRNDGSRVGFRFFNVARLADELAAAPDQDSEATNPRRALAPLDSGFNRDWDPQIPQSALADRTKLVKLLAYHYVQTTEPQEAVRRAVSDIFGDPTYIEQPGMKAWVPGKYDVEAVKSVADTLLRQVLGPKAAREHADESTGINVTGVMQDTRISPFGAYMRGGPLRGTSRADQHQNRGAALNKSKIADDSIILEIEPEGHGTANVRPVANIWHEFQGAGTFFANPGPKVSGAVENFNPRVEHGPAHFHLRLNDGREIRYLADTFEVHPYDKDKDTREHDKIIRRLSPEAREHLAKATHEMFETGKLSPEVKGESKRSVLKVS